MGTKGDIQALKHRWLRGAWPLQHGYTQAEVARIGKVSRNAVHLWARQLASGGRSRVRASWAPEG